MSRRLLAILAASLLLVLPVLVQQHIQAGDLASHLYNTWLVLLVRSGEPLGLEIAPQYSNVLFDWWLEALWRIGGPAFAEKAAVALAVLLFFWGAMFLLTRLMERPAWPGAPLVAMLAYGWVYHQGFFNYYLSCAFGFWAIGLAASGGRWALLAAPALLAAAAGHLLGAAAAAGFAAYVWAARRLPPRQERWIFGAALLGLAAAVAAAAAWAPARWHSSRLIHLSGVTVFYIYGAKYAIPALLVLGSWLWTFLAAESRWGWQAMRHRTGRLAALAAAAIVVLPTSLDWPGTRHSLHFIDWRMAPWLALLLHAWIGRLAPARFTLGAGSAAAVVFFLFLSADWRVLGGIENAFHEAAKAVPARARVVSGVTTTPLGMNPLLHMIDRACIGHCFSYGNYEPSSFAFRLRSKPAAMAVMSSPADVNALQTGRYTVRPEDLPLYGIYLRHASPFAVEVRLLEAGQRVRRDLVFPLPALF
jgi:hypothetical protein